MEQAGEYVVRAARDAVWAALNDPETLRKCIDGCQSMEQVDETHYATAVKAKIGPVSALFKADLALEDLDPPNSYSINASAKGGAAGFGNGVARVQLSDAGEDTLLQYTVSANVGGKLAQIGSRLIDGAARKMADDFFARFSAEVGRPEDPAAENDTDGGAEASAAEPAPADAPGTASVPSEGRSPDDYQPSQQWKIWAIMFGILLLAVVLTL